MPYPFIHQLKPRFNRRISQIIVSTVHLLLERLLIFCWPSQHPNLLFATLTMRPPLVSRAYLRLDIDYSLVHPYITFTNLPLPLLLSKSILQRHLSSFVILLMPRQIRVRVLAYSQQPLIEHVIFVASILIDLLIILMIVGEDVGLWSELILN